MCSDEPTEEEVFGPKDLTDANSSESDSEMLSRDSEEVTVVSVSIDVNGKESPSGSLSSADEHKLEDIAVEKDKSFVEMESTEVTIQPVDPNMSISVVDASNAESDDGDTSDDLSSEEDVSLPETPSSTGGEASRPSITVAETESERQPEAENNETQPKATTDKNDENAGSLGANSPIPADKRRPSGMLCLVA